MNEILTGSNVGGPIFSKFTMAVLEDSGWYDVTYNNLDDLSWGYQKGCNFMSNGCKNKGDYTEFCYQSSSSCNSQGNSKGSCQKDALSDGCFYFGRASSSVCKLSSILLQAQIPRIKTSTAITQA
jgi:hypothetical protein